MKLHQISDDSVFIFEGWGATAGHVALDAAGFVPFWGELADVSNALWYIGEREYFSAAMSVVSMIPDIGDVIGKAIKYLGKGGGMIAKFIAKYGPIISKYWGTAKQLIQKSQKLRPYARVLDRTVKDALATYGREKRTAQQQQPAKPAPQANPQANQANMSTTSLANQTFSGDPVYTQ